MTFSSESLAFDLGPHWGDAQLPEGQFPSYPYDSMQIPLCFPGGKSPAYLSIPRRVAIILSLFGWGFLPRTPLVPRQAPHPVIAIFLLTAPSLGMRGFGNSSLPNGNTIRRSIDLSYFVYSVISWKLHLEVGSWSNSLELVEGDPTQNDVVNQGYVHKENFTKMVACRGTVPVVTGNSMHPSHCICSLVNPVSMRHASVILFCGMLSYLIVVRYIILAALVIH